MSRALWVALILLGSGGCASKGALVEPEHAFNALALVPVQDASGRPLEVKGKVLLVTFFATWCFPCVGEVPLFKALQQEFGPSGFQVVGVGMDLDGERVLAPFVDYYQLTYPVIVADPVLREGHSVFGTITTLPTSFLLNREGKIENRWQGLANHEDLRHHVRDLLKD